MSRYHDAIVSSIVFVFVFGLVGIAELTKNKPTPNETAAPAVSADNKGGFSLAQVLVEQEMAALSKGQNGKQHEDQVRTQVARLSKSDIKMLKAKVRNSANTWEERNASAYLLRVAGLKVDAPQRPVLAQASTKSPVRTVASVSKAVAAKNAATKSVARGKAPSKQTKVAKQNPKRLSGQVASREIAVARR